MLSSLFPKASFTLNLFPLLARFSSAWDIHFSKTSTFEFLPHNLPTVQLFFNPCPPPAPDPVAPHPPTNPTSLVLIAHQFLPFPYFSSTLAHQDLLHHTATASIQSLLTNTFVFQLLSAAHQTHLPSPHFLLNRKRKSQIWLWQVFKKPGHELHLPPRCGGEGRKRGHV